MTWLCQAHWLLSAKVLPKHEWHSMTWLRQAHWLLSAKALPIHKCHTPWPNFFKRLLSAEITPIHEWHTITWNDSLLQNTNGTPWPDCVKRSDYWVLILHKQHAMNTLKKRASHISSHWPRLGRRSVEQFLNKWVLRRSVVQKCWATDQVSVAQECCAEVLSNRPSECCARVLSNRPKAEAHLIHHALTANSKVTIALVAFGGPECVAEDWTTDKPPKWVI
jgi:hypothetical protein